MADASTQASIEQVHQAIAEFCAAGQFDSAHLHLIQNGITAETGPGLWEYLARRAEVGGQQNIAHSARRTLWEANIWTGDVALKEAEYYLSRGDFSSCEFIIKAVFGSNPTNHQAQLLLARSHVLNGRARNNSAKALAERDAALALARRMSMEHADHARTAIDLLRYSDQYEKALEFSDEARAAFPDDVQFVIREARIRERLNDLERASNLWQQVADTSPRYRVEALFKILQLGRRLDRDDQVKTTGAELLLEPLPISDRLRLAIFFGQQSVVQALMELASAGGPLAEPITLAEGTAIADILLDNGDIGLVVWLRKLRIPIGEKAMAALDACGFGVNGTQPIPQTFSAAAKVRSPDFMLPLERFLEQEKMPTGWPGTGVIPDRILLVNAALGVGGAERQFVSLIRALLVAGIRPETLDVALFSLASDRGQAVFLPDLQELGVRIHDLRERKIANRALPAKVETMIRALPTPLRQDTTALWHLANEIRPNVMHGWQDRSALACGIVGQMLSTERLILSARNMAPVVRQDPGLMAMRDLYRDLATKENITLTANSSAGARDYEAWLDLPPGAVNLLSNAVDTERFSPASVKRAKRSGKGRPVRVTGIFRLVTNKRPKLWMQTVAELRHQHGIDLAPRIHGRGPLRDEVRRLAEDLNLADLVMDSVNSDPQHLYSEADILLLMSSVEGTPNVILEAQACGIPVAACDVGGVREALHQGGAGEGLLLDADIAPGAAARQIADWLPQAIAAPVDDRIAFVQNRYGMARIASRAEAFYCGFAGVAP